MKKTLCSFWLALLLAAFQPAHADRVMIVLQENGGSLIFLEGFSIPVQTKSTIEQTIDGMAETFMSFKAKLQGAGKYQRIINLTDAACTRANLLQHLITESKNGNIVDLYIFGHGLTEELSLKNEKLSGGTGGNIRSLLTDARNREGKTFQFSLRLVYMVNCFGASVNDDWQAIGADASVGSRCINWMPEPMATLFAQKFVQENKTVQVAAAESHAAASVAWYVPGAPLGYYDDDKHSPCGGRNAFETSQPIVGGNQQLKFNPEARSQTGLIGNGYEDVAEGTYYIISVASGKYLDARTDSKTENGHSAQVYNPSNSADRKWRLEKVGGLVGGYVIRNSYTGRVLDADMLNTANNGCKVQLWDRLLLGDRRHQEWYVRLNSNGYFEVTNVRTSTMYLDAHNDVDENGKPVKLWQRKAGDKTQRWYFVKTR